MWTTLPFLPSTSALISTSTQPQRGPLSQDLGHNDTGVISTFTGNTGDELVAGRLYPMTLEFRENYGAAAARLMWRSSGQLLEVRSRTYCTVRVRRADIMHMSIRGQSFLGTRHAGMISPTLSLTLCHVRVVTHALCDVRFWKTGVVLGHSEKCCMFHSRSFVRFIVNRSSKSAPCALSVFPLTFQTLGGSIQSSVLRIGSRGIFSIYSNGGSS